jgi:hypothetical protein
VHVWPRIPEATYGLKGGSTLVAISAGAAGLARGDVGVVRLLGHCGDVGGVIDGETGCWLGCTRSSESAGRRFQVLWSEVVDV